jgi:protein-disulfide isomerase
LVSTGILVRREFFAPPPVGGRAPGAPTPLKDWERYATDGRRLGAPDGKVVLVQFADFECPACRSFHERSLQPALIKHAANLTVVYRHFPLPTHKFAYGAARAAECAAEQGRFASIYDRLYAAQDSFGLKPWSVIAAEAGVPDTAAFTACTSVTTPLPNVERDLEAGRALKVAGTPTFLLNGQRDLGGIDSTSLDSLIVEALRKGR